MKGLTINAVRWLPGLAGIVLLCFFLSVSTQAADIQEVTAPKSGVKAWLVEDHHLPIVSIHFAFEGGSEQDPADKQGLATLTMDALSEGAGSYDAAVFQKLLADHSISLDFSAGRDLCQGSIKFLSADKTIAYNVLHLALTKPRFDPDAIERLRAQQLTAIRKQIASPGWQARYALYSHIFAGHPYGQRSLGSTQTLQAITRADIRDFATGHLADDNLIVAVAGDITPQQLAVDLDKIFADLPQHAHLRAIADAPEATPGQTILARRDGTQSQIMFALPGPRRDSEDWYAAEIANYILGGGGFQSRLMHDVRDEKGLTYGIDTSLSSAEHAGLIIGNAAVDNDKTAAALDVIRDTMRHFHDNGASSKEITAAKDYLTGALPLALTSTDKIASFLVELQHDHLGRDYLDRYETLINDVNEKEVNSIIGRWFDPDKANWVIVGKPVNVVASKTQDIVRQ